MIAASSMSATSSAVVVKKVCGNCGMAKCRLKCGRCRVQYYCSEVCERNHWQGSHGRSCSPIQTALPVPAAGALIHHHNHSHSSSIPSSLSSSSISSSPSSHSSSSSSHSYISKSKKKARTLDEHYRTMMASNSTLSSTSSSHTTQTISRSASLKSPPLPPLREIRWLTVGNHGNNPSTSSLSPLTTSVVAATTALEPPGPEPCPVCGEEISHLTQEYQEHHLMECLGDPQGSIRRKRAKLSPSISLTGGTVADYVASPLTVKVEGWKGDEMTECSICLEDFEIGVPVATMSCFCFYHEKCLRDWFARRRQCPLHE